jgi:hypothetical protein
MENQGSSGKSSGTNKVILVVLILSLIGNIWQWRNESQTVETYDVKVDSLVTARVDVEKELTETYAELNKYKGISTRLDSLLSEANTKVADQETRIKQLIREARKGSDLNKKLKAELEELKKLRDDYLEKIDQLLVENEQLKKDKTELTGTVESLTKNLETTVNTASMLKSEYIKVNSFKRKNNDKYTTTAMAKRTNKLEACFSILENKIAKPGEKTVYLRIVEPGGKTLGNRSEGSSTFKAAGSSEDVMYTASQTVTYTNAKQDLCMSWEEKDRGSFAPGTYVVEIYIDGNLSGASSVVLR